MTRLGLVFVLVAVCASSAPVASAAQRGGGQGQGGPVGRSGGPARLARPPVIPQRPSINRPSFPGGPARFARPSVIPEQPSINRPSFPIGGLNRPSFPLHGPLGVGRVRRSPFAATPRTYSRPSRFAQIYGSPFGYGFGLPAYADTAMPDKRYESRSDEDILSGTVFLDSTPRTAMVFIDSAYVGTVDDLLFTGVTLSAGRHWLELEAPEYEKKLIEINVTPERPLRYRAELTPVRRAALVVIPPRPPETMYTIPGCYGGNRPPVAAALPPGCDIKNVRVIRPQRPN